MIVADMKILSIKSKCYDVIQEKMIESQEGKKGKYENNSDRKLNINGG